MKKYLFVILFLFTSILSSQALKTFYATQVHITQTNPSSIDTLLAYKILDSIQSAGITFIRDECLWSEVEKSPGVYSFSPAVDNFMIAAQQRGISVLLILDYNNTLYCGNSDPGTGPVTDSNRAAYSRYCQAMVSHFSPLGVKYYEIWNEPNIPIFWRPAPNATDYARLLQSAYPAIKQVDSTVTVLGCATSPAEGNPAPFIMWRTFIQGVWQAGGGNYMDGISFHQYRVDRSPESYLATDIQNLQNIVGGLKPIYITELGYHTSTVWPNTSLQKQAYYVCKLYVIGRTFPQLKAISYYDFRNDGEDPANPEHNFGLIYNNLTPKPAYNAYKLVTKYLTDKNYISQNISSTYYRYNFSNSNETVNLFFNSAASVFTKPEIFSKNILKFHSLFGVPYYVYDKDKIVNIDYQEEPLFVVGMNTLPNIEKLEILPQVDTVVAGQKISLSIQGKTTDGLKILIDSGAVVWSFSNSYATIDSNGILSANRTGQGNIIANFNGIQVQKSIYIIASLNYYEIEKFDNLNRLSPSFFTMLPETNLQIVDTNYTSPAKSLLINYAFKYEAIDRHRVIFDCDYTLYGEPDTIMVDIFNNNNGHVVEFQVADKDSEIFKVNTSQIQSKIGWLTTRAKLTGFGSKFQYPCRLKKIIFYCVKNSGIRDSIYSGQVLIDNLRIHNSIPADIKEENFDINKKIFFLSQNYPNPFNPNTIINYEIPTPPNSSPYQREDGRGSVSLKIYDILGRAIETLVNEPQSAGKYSVEWNASKFSSGIYYYELNVGNGLQPFRAIKKMMLLK